MSVAAADFLIANGVDCACETKTEKLLNRQGTGLCPFEQAVLELQKPEDCLPVIRQTLARLMAGKIINNINLCNQLLHFLSVWIEHILCRRNRHEKTACFFAALCADA